MRQLLLLLALALALPLMNCGCEEPACPEDGVEGCPCLEGEIPCRGDGLLCNADSVCEAKAPLPDAGPECVVGAVGCACDLGDACSDDAYACASDGVCRPESCSDGALGCACAESGSCDGDLVCSDNNTCIGASCSEGEQGCPCAAGGSCAGGLQCVDNICVSPASGEIGSCYIPCQQGAVVGGVYRPCSSDGLMRFAPGETCLDDGDSNTPAPVCTEGNCLAASQQAPECTSATDCADFMACIEGQCRPECEHSSQCASGLQCQRKVCREPCTATGADCPEGETCQTSDGENGFCIPLAEPEGDEQVTVVGGFDVLTDAPLSFSNLKTTSYFDILNDSPVYQEFKVRKVEHTEFNDSGPLTDRDTPLFWVKLGETEGATEQVSELTVGVDAGQAKRVYVEEAHNDARPLWQGAMEVTHADLGTRSLPLAYARRPEGRWQGRMYFFGVFPDQGIDAWLADPGKIGDVKNAFIKKWTEFEAGTISLDEWEAVVTATQEGSWRYENVKARCPTPSAPDPDKGCYLYDNTQGYALYSSSLSSRPIPSGVVELPVGLNLRQSPSGAATVLEGRIETSESLHLPGDPYVRMELAGDPTSCTNMNGASCIVPIESMQADIFVGGRYLTDSSDVSCDGVGAPGDFELTALPWLVAGFDKGTEIDPLTGLRYRYECRDSTLPFDAPELEPNNLALAISNPVPDGRPRKRTLELLDGALINQDSIVVLFRERFPSFLSETDDDIVAYGFMMLQKGAANLDEEAFIGSAPTDTRPIPAVDTLRCEDWLLAEMGVGSVAGNENKIVSGLIEGIVPGTTPTTVAPSLVHYFCEDTGQIDGGADAAAPQPCPAGSDVTYFLLDSEPPGGIAAVPCQTTGTCQQTLNNWVANGSYNIQVDPIWRCTDTNKVYCDDVRTDLRAGKSFYGEAATEAVFVPLLPHIDNAFRYKTRFQNRTGDALGFAPEICIPGSDQIPYCYDPRAIDDITDRVDCALSLYSDTASRASLDTATRTLLESYLRANFSWTEEDIGEALPLVHDGFEKLNAELLIMLGDDAYTDAFAARFDLAGAGVASFEGELFELGGINLSGAAGFEMFKLYLATQYYQMALDRFFELGPHLFVYLEMMSGKPDNPALDVAEAYFGRLIRASSQKTRAWSEIAKRYQSFGRPDLARAVIERSYAGAYLESVIFSRMMLRLSKTAALADRAQIDRNNEISQLGYRAALLDMRDVYTSITDEVNYFGYAPDYIPFPALDASDPNAFEKALSVAKQRMLVAADKELSALSSDRSYETDAAAFQSELTRVRNNYENQLADVCGTFPAPDGNVYPAIRKYAYLSDQVSRMGDPCGLVGNGALHEAMAGLEFTDLDFQSVVLGHDNVVQQIEIERERVNTQCNLTLELADYRWNVQGAVNDLHEYIGKSRFAINTAQRAISHAGNIASLSKCSIGPGGTDCVTGFAALGVYGAVAAGLEAVSVANEAIILHKEEEIAELQQKAAYWETVQQCDVAMVNSNATVKNLLLELNRYELEALRADYSLRLAVSRIEQLRHSAQRLMAEQEESEQLAINLQAAQNNPNIRIYKNDAILTADRTFAAAVREAYKATRVFEYYTSQSYAGREDLFLVRMVAAGDTSLEQYLFELEDEFLSFEELYGNPDLRVAVVSLRDDILGIPTLNDSNQPLAQVERVGLLRAALTDPRRLDENGYLTLPFGTRLEQLSPLTRNHKVAYVEAEIVGSNIGDTVGRVYLRASGTGTVSSLVGPKRFYAFPERTAVMNPFFNGQRVFTPEIYRNNRLKDRPLANSRWELVLNQRDEQANQDIDVNSLTDVRLYVYYTDFTAF